MKRIEKMYSKSGIETLRVMGTIFLVLGILGLIGSFVMVKESQDAIYFVIGISSLLSCVLIKGICNALATIVEVKILSVDIDRLDRRDAMFKVEIETI